MNFKRTNNNDYSNYEINMRAENLFKTHSGFNTIAWIELNLSFRLYVDSWMP